MSTAAPRMGTYQKPLTYGATYQQPPAPPRVIPDDYEKWYTEPSASNRMLLALRSGIPKEINWALERMCRLSHNDQFILRKVPGLADALIEWPEWYVQKGIAEFEQGNIFSIPPAIARRRRHALEAMFILRNCSVNDPNAIYLSTHRRTLLLLKKALDSVQPDSDANSEFLLHVVDLLHSVVLCFQHPVVESLSTNTLIRPLEELTEKSNDRTMIITALRTLTHIITFPQNAVHITSTSPALVVTICYLPLLNDTPLITACLDYLYAHLSSPAMVRAFLHHPNMPGTLKILVALLLQEQQEELTAYDLIHEPIRSAPAVVSSKRQYELSEEELDRISKTNEPERSYEWMRALFSASDAEEVTQVEFWNLYRDTFIHRQDIPQSLTAAEVIKNITHIFPTAQAMVLPAQPPRFVIKGITRRMIEVKEERFKCHWEREVCPTVCNSPEELWTHVLEHINSSPEVLSCEWGPCQFSLAEHSALSRHVSTHIPPAQPPVRHPSQLEKVTLPITPWPHPSANPTSRPPPPPPNPQVVYPYPSTDPPSTSLTALLIIRVLFRASFAATEAAPRADEDHFGFPGIVEEDSDDENQDKEEDLRGQRRGRKAFTGVRRLLEYVRVRDVALMGWIGEILDVSMEEKPANV